MIHAGMTKTLCVLLILLTGDVLAQETSDNSASEPVESGVTYRFASPEATALPINEGLKKTSTKGLFDGIKNSSGAALFLWFSVLGWLILVVYKARNSMRSLSSSKRLKKVTSKS